jgi:hypothetical protein
LSYGAAFCTIIISAVETALLNNLKSILKQAMSKFSPLFFIDLLIKLTSYLTLLELWILIRLITGKDMEEAQNRGRFPPSQPKYFAQ